MNMIFSYNAVAMNLRKLMADTVKIVWEGGDNYYIPSNIFNKNNIPQYFTNSLWKIG